MVVRQARLAYLLPAGLAPFQEEAVVRVRLEVKEELLCQVGEERRQEEAAAGDHPCLAVLVGLEVLHSSQPEEVEAEAEVRQEEEEEEVKDRPLPEALVAVAAQAAVPVR